MNIQLLDFILLGKICNSVSQLNDYYLPSTQLFYHDIKIIETHFIMSTSWRSYNFPRTLEVSSIWTDKIWKIKLIQRRERTFTKSRTEENKLNLGNGEWSTVVSLKFCLHQKHVEDHFIHRTLCLRSNSLHLEWVQDFEFLVHS